MADTWDWRTSIISQWYREVYDVVNLLAQVDALTERDDELLAKFMWACNEQEGDEANSIACYCFFDYYHKWGETDRVLQDGDEVRMYEVWLHQRPKGLGIKMKTYSDPEYTRIYDDLWITGSSWYFSLSSRQGIDDWFMPKYESSFLTGIPFVTMAAFEIQKAPELPPLQY